MADPRRLSTKHKAYAAAVAVAAAALAYDRSRSAGPSPARAAAGPLMAAVATVTTPEADGPGTSASAGLAARLRAVAGGRPDPLVGLRDAFAPSAAWAAERRPAADVPAADSGAAAEAFAAGHKLSVVLLAAGDRGGAVIGGRLVRVGQAVDGYRLTAVGRRSARLAGPAGDVELRMP